MSTEFASTNSKSGKLEPPYGFKSVKELKKNQTRYNQYNLFYMVERFSLMKAHGTMETINPPDERSNVYKMYKDFVVPPLPPAYAHLELPSYWIMHMHTKKQSKRSHKKGKGGCDFMSFQELAKAVADGYKAIDSTTKAWLDELSDGLIQHNKAMREDLEIYLREHGESFDGDEEESVAAGKAKSSASKAKRKDGEPEDVPEDITEGALSRAASTKAMGLAAIEERLRRHIHDIRMQHSMHDFAIGSRSDAHGISPSPRGIPSPYPGHSPFHHLPLHPADFSCMGPRLPHPTHREQAPKRSYDQVRPFLGREEKRARTDHHQAALNDLRARVAYQEAHLEVKRRDLSLTSTLEPPFPSMRGTSGLASLRREPRPCSTGSFDTGAGSRAIPSPRTERHDDQLLLGYQLGLQAAARAQARAASVSCRGPDTEFMEGFRRGFTNPSPYSRSELDYFASRR